MIVDGKAIAEKIKKGLKVQIAGQPLKLVVILVGDDPVSLKYVERKKRLGEELGIEVVVHEYPADIEEDDLISELNRLAIDNGVNGIIVQLPLPVRTLAGGPKKFDQPKILNLIPGDKDVDALGDEAKVLSPTVGAIKEILTSNNIDLENKKIVVVGNGKLVGRPVSIWLAQEGVAVGVVDLGTKNSDEILKQADLVISGVGEPGLITPDKIKAGVVLIDAGTAESGGQLKGDADPVCAEKCSLFTPVPGGVGPLTTIMLFKNLLELNS